VQIVFARVSLSPPVLLPGGTRDSSAASEGERCFAGENWGGQQVRTCVTSLFSTCAVTREGQFKTR
jgi:hypothetical protein